MRRQKALCLGRLPLFIGNPHPSSSKPLLGMKETEEKRETPSGGRLA